MEQFYKQYKEQSIKDLDLIISNIEKSNDDKDHIQLITQLKECYRLKFESYYEMLCLKDNILPAVKIDFEGPAGCVAAPGFTL